MPQSTEQSNDLPIEILLQHYGMACLSLGIETDTKQDISLLATADMPDVAILAPDDEQELPTAVPVSNRIN